MIRSSAKFEKVKVKTKNVAKTFVLIFPSFDFFRFLNMFFPPDFILVFFSLSSYIYIALFSHFLQLMSIYVFLFNCSNSTSFLNLFTETNRLKRIFEKLHFHDIFVIKRNFAMIILYIYIIYVYVNFFKWFLLDFECFKRFF